MIDPPGARPSGNRAFHVETIGVDHVPDAERTMTVPRANLFMIGVQANLVPVVLGVVGVTQGLPLWQAVLAALLGGVLYVYVAYACLAGPRAGVPTLVFTRAAFGVRGNVVNGVLAWVVIVAFEAVNTVFATYALLAVLPYLGVPDPGVGAKVGTILGVSAVSAFLAIFGHATLVHVQRFLTVVLVVCLALTFVVVIGTQGRPVTGGVPLTGGAALAAFSVAVSVNASNAISYLFIAPDWFRYLPRRIPGRRLFWNLLAAGGLTAGLLAALGAVLAARGDMSDPVASVRPMVPAWLFVAFAVAVVGGTVANNAPTLYSSGLTLQAVGLPVRRYAATAVDVIVSTALTLYVVVDGDFLAAINDFVALMVVWAGPFGGVWLTDAVLRRWRWSPDDLRATAAGAGGRYRYRRGWHVQAWIALGVGMAASLLTIDAPVYQGPVSVALGGADLSWLVGFWLSAGVYAAIARGSVRRSAAGP